MRVLAGSEYGVRVLTETELCVRVLAGSEYGVRVLTETE